MIDLRVKIDPLPIEYPLVVRLIEEPVTQPTEHEAVLISADGSRREYDFHGFSLTLYPTTEGSFDGDVLLVFPNQTSAHRLIRADSKHNTFLVTEQCDQLCVMCSQPPKKHHADLFDFFELAASLAPVNAYIGISGGEPLLHKARVFGLIESVAAIRPDVRFHVLTNAQHFEREDIVRIHAMGADRVLWGVPLYSTSPEAHDQIVGKAGAFRQLERGLNILMNAGASVELRTVVLKQNQSELPKIADFLSTRLPSLTIWALMQLEKIGYGKMNWKQSFLDTSMEFQALKSGINLATAKGLKVALYNFPLCSVPKEYRKFAPSTISDWKRKYLDFCTGCNARDACGGFFQWYTHNEGFSALGPL